MRIILENSGRCLPRCHRFPQESTLTTRSTNNGAKAPFVDTSYGISTTACDNSTQIFRTSSVVNVCGCTKIFSVAFAQLAAFNGHRSFYESTSDDLASSFFLHFLQKKSPSSGGSTHPPFKPSVQNLHSQTLMLRPLRPFILFFFI